MDSCEADIAIKDQLDEVKYAEESKSKGHIDAACSIAKRSIEKSRQNPICQADIRNEMAVAILNSNIKGLKDDPDDDDSSSEESMEHGFGACRAHFDTRYAVGTNNAKEKALRKFSSQEFRTHYVRFTNSFQFLLFLSQNKENKYVKQDK